MIEFNKLNFENEKIKLSKSTIELLNIISLKFLKYSNLLFNKDQIFSEDLEYNIVKIFRIFKIII